MEKSKWQNTGGRQIKVKKLVLITLLAIAIHTNVVAAYRPPTAMKVLLVSRSISKDKGHDSADYPWYVHTFFLSAMLLMMCGIYKYCELD